MGDTVIVKQGQCLLDIALQTSGSIDAAFELAELNGISITDDLMPGDELLTVGVKDKAVIAYYNANKIIPASGDLRN